MTEISIAEDFSKVPAGRYHPKDGNRTGQRFRDEFLEKLLRNGNERITVILDGVVGLPSSFLEEAFGGLVRNGYDFDTLKERLSIETSEERKKRHISQIWQYIEEAREKALA